MANTVSPARGMRDILPQEQAKREYVLNIIKNTYKKFGFDEIETPAVEIITRLKSNQGGDNESMLFEIMKRGLDKDADIRVSEAADLGLRYDLTLPLSRFYSSHASELPKVFRVLQTGPVWRAERPQKGRYRQFRQCDIDILGEESVLAEIELIIATLSAFKALKMENKVTLHLNDRRILRDLLLAFDVEEQKCGDVLISLDKWDKIGRDGVSEEIVSKELLSQTQCTLLVDAVEELRNTTNIVGKDEITFNGKSINLYDLPKIVETVNEVLPQAKIVFDISLVRGMGYYTGPIFEVVHDDFSSSVAGGGRYDKMIGKWLGKDVPACGFSIGFERIIDLVDLNDESAEKCAVLYSDNISYKDMFKIREIVMQDSIIPVFVKPPRKLNANFFERLTSEGCKLVLDIREFDFTDSDSVGKISFKELSR
ncbi:histidine--tRNA ligase [Actinomyces sp. zg-332]|uniref:histidine--tRNA ligase n=1 Tax=Actinomyces sp. zg-332 TaxID=2708340 RepID=UPI00141E305D|nr:ATP phosphoribosyltransferase regulatory subunit [Actinomyces sp. zg-332]QPK94088.1 histidine--tRNA ligase [Actinomyces sp. zg-332]